MRGRAPSDWRNETARDVGFGNWEAEESRGARISALPAPCPQGQHRMHPDGRGGGVCQCGETVSAEEL